MKEVDMKVGTYYGVKIEEEVIHEYEKLNRGGMWENGQEKWRDDLYNDIVKQLKKLDISEVSND